MDVIVFTADHGHVAAGGHGGGDPEVELVEACFAGRGVAHTTGPEGTLRARDVAPALALLAGLPFPRHMRAGPGGTGDDDLDVLWELVDTRAFPADYLADRRAAVARFRAANAAAVGSWRDFYHAARDRQAWRLIVVAATLGGLLGAAVAARSPRRAVGLVAYLGWLVVATLVGHVLVRGSLDVSAINKRADYISVAFTLCLGVAASGLTLHLALGRKLGHAVADQTVAVAAGLIVVVGHPFVFGVPLGFPLPGPFLYFLPFLSAIFVVVHAALLATLALLARVSASMTSSSS
jgi:hypothetical protein